ncbi:MAG: hypothetical protein J6C82_01885 [Clostridia bacterium]|nr:hypothetical protein [Clostridia bacterium]
MRKIFAFSGDDSDISALLGKGFCGALMSMQDISDENVRKVKACGLEVWIYADAQEVGAEYLCCEAGRVSSYDGMGKVANVETLERLESEIGDILFDEVVGFVVPLPYFDAPIWNDELNEMCGFSYEAYELLFALFDSDTEISPVRSWYYERAESYIISKYVLPLSAWAKEKGKKISFDIGKTESEFDFPLRMISPIRYPEAGLSLTVRGHCSTEMSALFSTFSEIDGIFAAENIEEDADFSDIGTAELLLIKPTRGVMERYARETRKMKCRMETPAVVAAAEYAYYCNMLYKKGIAFDVADEFSIERMGKAEDGVLTFDGRGYRNILLCDSCIFSKNAIEILKNAQANGVCINDEALIKFLDSEPEEED